MSKGLSGLGVIAVLSVPVGSLISTYLGWRFALLSLAIYGSIALVWMFFKFEETNQRRNPDALRPAIIVSTWRSILTHSQFWTYALLALTSYCSLFVFLATSSFIFLKVLATGKVIYSVVVAAMSLTYIVGTFISRRLMVRHGVQRMVWIGGWITLAACLAYATVLWLAPGNVWALALSHWLLMLGHGFHQPAGQSGRMQRVPHRPCPAF
jgi:MFS transporter, DHA1 family, multidrug resistance protein